MKQLPYEIQEKFCPGCTPKTDTSFIDKQVRKEPPMSEKLTLEEIQQAQKRLGIAITPEKQPDVSAIKAECDSLMKQLESAPQMSELRECPILCPYCNAEMKLLSDVGGLSTCQDLYFMSCPKCGSNGPSVLGDEDASIAKAKVRPTEDRLREKLTEARLHECKRDLCQERIPHNSELHKRYVVLKIENDALRKRVGEIIEKYDNPNHDLNGDFDAQEIIDELKALAAQEGKGATQPQEVGDE